MQRQEPEQKTSSTVPDKKVEMSITDSTIYNPKVNCTYHLKNPDYETAITFSGNAIKDCQFIDLATGTFSVHLEPIQIHFDSFYLVSAKSLPFNATPKEFSPKLYAYLNNELITFKKINFQLEHAENKRFNVGININEHKSKPDVLENKSILDMLKKFLPKTKVEVGKYPMFLKKNRPSREFLESLYEKFMLYNDIDKLSYQYRSLDGMCHIRAHFFNRFLEELGIQSFKVFKYWEKPEEWRKFDAKQVWSFHCAALVIDQDNKLWIWDPWVGHNQKLLTPQEWFYRNDEPKPDSALITSSLNIVIPAEKREKHYPNFMTDASDDDIKTLQAAFTNAIPNPPQFFSSPTSAFEERLNRIEQIARLYEQTSKEERSFFAGKKRKAENSTALEKSPGSLSVFGSMIKRMRLELSNVNNSSRGDSVLDVSRRIRG